MELGHLRALVAVIDEDGFTAAAQRLGVTQSTVSRTVAGLERDLGVPLLIRGPRGSHTPTGIGTRVVEQARHVLDRVARIDAIARAERDSASGDLRIGTMPSVGPLLAPMIAAFGREHPGIRTTLLEGRDQELARWLVTDFVDLATTATNAAAGQPEAPQPAAGSWPLARDRWVVALAPDHPLADVSRVRLEDLEDDTLIMSGGGCEPLLRAIYDKQGLRYRADHRITDPTTLLTLVREGMGVTVVPEFSLGTFPGIVAIPVDTDVERVVHLTPAENDRGGRAARRFLEFAARKAWA